jgi:hypothetical protein
MWKNIPQYMRRIKNLRLDTPSVFAYFESNSPDIVAITRCSLSFSRAFWDTSLVDPDRLSFCSLEIETRYSFRRERQRRDAERFHGHRVGRCRRIRSGRRRRQRGLRRGAGGPFARTRFCAESMRRFFCNRGTQFSGLAPVQGREGAGDGGGGVFGVLLAADPCMGTPVGGGRLPS